MSDPNNQIPIRLCGAAKPGTGEDLRPQLVQVVFITSVN